MVEGQTNDKDNDNDENKMRRCEDTLTIYQDIDKYTKIVGFSQREMTRELIRKENIKGSLTQESK